MPICKLSGLSWRVTSLPVAGNGNLIMSEWPMALGSSGLSLGHSFECSLGACLFAAHRLARCYRRIYESDSGQQARAHRSVAICTNLPVSSLSDCLYYTTPVDVSG